MKIGADFVDVQSHTTDTDLRLYYKLHPCSTSHLPPPVIACDHQLRPPYLSKSMNQPAAYASPPPIRMLTRSPILRSSARRLVPQAKRPRLPRGRASPICTLSTSPKGSELEDALPADHAQHCAQMLLYDLRDGLVPYARAWELQHALVDARRKDASLPDAVILLEHEPVYTLGTASSLDHVLFSGEELRRGQVRVAGCKDAPLLVRTERGGEVTYHGPGQLVMYPILNLSRHRKDLHWYLRSLEEVVVRALREHYGLQAGRKEGLTGVWVGEEKVCALGLKVSRWITMHGLALNVCADLRPFERIVACGIEGKSVTSLHLLAHGETSMEMAKRNVVQSFCDVFGPYDVVPTEV